MTKLVKQACYKLANLFLIWYLCIMFVCTQAMLPFNFESYVLESLKLFYDVSDTHIICAVSYFSYVL